jgi:hypothetical protein
MWALGAIGYGGADKPMALIHCQDCNREMSDLAATCPHCGRPNPTVASSHRVNTAEDSFLTRNRGFGDLLMYGCFFVIGGVLQLILFSTLWRN